VIICVLGFCILPIRKLKIFLKNLLELIVVSDLLGDTCRSVYERSFQSPLALLMTNVPKVLIFFNVYSGKFENVPTEFLNGFSYRLLICTIEKVL